MTKTLLDKFKEYPNILNETFNMKKLNRTKDNSFEVTNELIDELNIPKENQNTLKFIFYELYINNTEIIAQKIPKEFINGTIIQFRVDLSSRINMYNYLNQIEYKLY